MRKSIIRTTVCLLLALALSLTFFAACGDNRPNVNVTVDGGTGGGAYYEGDECTVTATVPDGYKFVEWTVYGVPVSTSNPYVFDVDFDIEIKAVFEALPVDKYTVTVNGGTIGENGASSAALDKGSEASIYAAESQARKFVKWIIGNEESTQNPYKLTVTKDVEITAVFDEFCMISVSGGIVGDSRSAIVPQGSEVTVNANAAPAGQRFVYWYTLDENFSEVKVSETASYTFRILDSMKIYAKFLYSFTVNAVNGTVGDTGEATAEILDGETVTITPDAPPSPDKAFIGWFRDDVKISLNKNLAVTVTNNITVEAKYGELRTVELPKPDSSENTSHPTDGIIYREGGVGSAIALDRLTSSKTKSMFGSGVAYVRYDVYTSPSADKTQPVGSFRIRVDFGADPAGGTAMTGWVETADGSVSEKIVRGVAGDYYVNSTEVGIFFNVLRKALGYSYGSGQNYYFAATASSGDGEPLITFEDDFALKYVDSERSEISTSAIVESPGTPVGSYAVNVLNGTIGDEELTQVTAAHGASITVNATIPEDDTVEWVFLGWKEVTYDGETEVLGATLSRNLSYTFGASKDLTLKAVFADRSTITQTQLPMPDNSQNKLIYEEGGPLNAIALDRAGDKQDVANSMFSSNVDYVVFYMYTSPEAAKTDYVGSFIMKVDINKPGDGGQAIVGYFALTDGSHKTDIIRGLPNNYYHQDRGAFNTLVKAALGENYDSSAAYYFAAQSVALTEEYLDSEISVIGTNGIKF